MNPDTSPRELDAPLLAGDGDVVDQDDRIRLFGAAAAVHRTHVRMLLHSAGTTGNLDAQTDALLALLEADYVSHQHDDLGHSLPTQGDAWESVAHKLCGC